MSAILKALKKLGKKDPSILDKIKKIGAKDPTVLQRLRGQKGTPGYYDRAASGASRAADSAREGGRKAYEKTRGAAKEGLERGSVYAADKYFGTIRPHVVRNKDRYAAGAAGAAGLGIGALAGSQSDGRKRRKYLED